MRKKITMKILKNLHFYHGFIEKVIVFGKLDEKLQNFDEIWSRVLIKFSIPGVVLQLTAAIQLEGLVTKKPRVSKYTMKPQVVR